MARYIWEKYPSSTRPEGTRTACFMTLDDRTHDLVALDCDHPNRLPDEIHVDSKGETKKLLWRFS